jgi:hypothetical protein
MLQRWTSTVGKTLLSSEFLMATVAHKWPNSVPCTCLMSCYAMQSTRRVTLPVPSKLRTSQLMTASG